MSDPGLTRRCARFVPLLCLLVSACATAPPHRAPDPEVAKCRALFAATDAAVARDGYSPTAAARIEGFPYLRTDRFLASLRIRDGGGAWLDRLATLDRQAREVELASLPAAVTDDLTRRHAAPLPLADALGACAARLRASDAADPASMEALGERAAVPPDYRVVSRVAGLYPLAAIAVRLGIARWHDEAHETFSLPLHALPRRGQLQRFGPAGAAAPAPVRIGSLPHDSVGIPAPDPAQLAALVAAHAPVWEIDVAGDFDLPGAPYWQAPAAPAVDTGKPLVYAYPSYTRWNGDSLLQLNYVVWFGERPAEGPADVLAGLLDGLVWRVTLDAEGRPLIYDSIHNCGCYHQFFPSKALRLREDAKTLAEPPLVPQAAPWLAHGERVVVRLSSGRHYLERVYKGTSDRATYAIADYQALYAIPGEGGPRSLFGADGLVPGTERPERFLLWPMGIPSAGAMRERGRHATAFIGRRHFDDADLLDRLFEPVPPG